MSSSKGASEVLSAVLIVILAIGLVATAYTYGLPLIQKRQDTTIVDRVESSFNQGNANSLPSRIETVANTGGSSVFNLDVQGRWRLFPCNEKDSFGNFRRGCVDLGAESLNNNTIEFSFISRVTDIAADSGWVSLTSGAACPPSAGILGKDKASVVCARADTLGGGDFSIVYRVYFRELIDPSLKSAFKINLMVDPASSTLSTGKTVRATFDSRASDVIRGLNTVITTVKILLV